MNEVLKSIREAFISWHCEDQSGEHYVPADPKEVGEVFDAALAEHDRAVKTQTLREAANDIPRRWCQEGGPSDWLEDLASQL